MNVKNISFSIFLIFNSLASMANASVNVCSSREFTENIAILDDQQQFIQKQMRFYKNISQEIKGNYQVTSKGHGLQQAFFGISSYAMTAALLLEGFGVKTAGGLVANGRIPGLWIQNAATKWQAVRKVMLLTEESFIYPLAPMIFSGYSSPKRVGEGLAEFMIGGDAPLENNYDIESVPLVGFTSMQQWDQFQNNLKDDLHNFHKVHLSIYAQRAQYDEMLHGITFKFFMSEQKEYFQKLYDETTAHLKLYQFQSNYLKLIKSKLQNYCSSQDILSSIPTRSPLVLKEIPAFTEAEYLKNVSRFSAPVKRALNRFERYSLSTAKAEWAKYQHSSYLPEKVKIFLEIMANIMTPLHDPKKQARLDRIMNELRPYVYDNGMRDCYNAQLMGSEIQNAINIGCDTYVTSSLMERLNDLELKAVLAHELSHGDQGHLLVNVANEGSSLKKHIKKYFSGIVNEASSGVTGSYLASIKQSGHLDSFISTYSELAPQIEIQADQGGVLILNRAGIDRKHLIKALVILHDLDPAKVDMKRPETFGPSNQTNGVRNYPGLYTRIRAINAVAVPKKP